MKEVIKSKTKKVLIIVLIILLLFIYLLIDWKNLYVDIYNFRQLDKAKPYLETIDKNTKDFYFLKDFKEINIKPIKNCYYIRKWNWKYLYIFWFKLESILLKFLYRTEYYSYPHYDLPVKISWQPIWITKLPDNFNPDSNRRIFESIISNPCEE